MGDEPRPGNIQPPQKRARIFGIVSDRPRLRKGRARAHAAEVEGGHRVKAGKIFDLVRKTFFTGKIAVQEDERFAFSLL